MLHAIVVVLRHAIPCDMCCVADVGQGQGLDLGWVGDLGWGGVGLGSWGWAFSFLCFGIVECAHGHAYAKQVRIMCVLSVPLLDQVGFEMDAYGSIWAHIKTGRSHMAQDHF